jgi:predicted ATPase/class 3 adenylate cyclase/Tfp pilus assembly protein PilF
LHKNVAVAFPSGTATFLFTDVEGSTDLLGRLGSEGYAGLLAEHHRLVRDALSTYGGTEIDTQGDAFFAVFSSPRNCAMAAISIQQSLAATTWPNDEQVRVRMGFHHGEAAETPTGPVGFDVHRAARVAAVAHGGQIVLSETAAALLEDSLPEGASLQDLGQHRLKDLRKPQHLFQLNALGLEARFPPLRSLDNPDLEHNLPIQLTTFVGRERELQDIRRLIDESRLVTLAGPGGSGKTRLALHLAADVLDGSDDGVWLVDLAALSSEEQVAREVASVLGVREEASRPVLDTLIESLQYRKLLVILDNCEHLVDPAAKLAESVVRQCPDVWILATSREPLAVVGERVYRVPPLRLPDVTGTELDLDALGSSEAVRLFVERAKEHRPEFSLDRANAATIVAVCRHLDGIPLALELAAARVRSMSLEDVERHLGRRFRLLGARARTGAARQQTLEGAVAWSYELLNEDEKKVFAILSVFPGSFDLPAAESVGSKAAALDDFEVVDLVESLVDKSLLQTEQGPDGLRYRMLETIAQYSADRLRESGDDAMADARIAHALYYLGVTEEQSIRLTGPDQATWMVRFASDLDNFRTALRSFADSVDHEIEGLRLVAALRPFWERFGSTPGEARDLALATLANGRADASRERSAALLSLAYAHYQFGDFAASRRTLEDGLSIAERISDERLVCEHRVMLVFLLYRLGEHDRASQMAGQTLEMATALGDPNILALAHDRVGSARSDDDPAAAREHYAAAIHLFQSVGNLWRVAIAYSNLGNLEMIAGDFEAARRNLDAALKNPVTPDNRAFALSNLGILGLLEGDARSAEASYRESLRLFVRLGFGYFIPYAFLGLAMSATAFGDLERAAVLHGAAAALLEPQGVPFEPLEESLRQRDIAGLRQRIGEPAFQASYSAGHDMTRPDAIAYALESDGDTIRNVSGLGEPPAYGP